MLNCKFWFLSSLGVWLLLQPSLSWAWSKAKPNYAPPPRKMDGKKVIQLSPVHDVQIEMPGRAEYHFGEDFQISLTTRLTQSGRYIVMDSGSAEVEGSKASHAGENSAPDNRRDSSSTPVGGSNFSTAKGFSSAIDSVSNPLIKSDQPNHLSQTDHLSQSDQSDQADQPNQHSQSDQSSQFDQPKPSNRAPAGINPNAAQSKTPNHPHETKVCRKKFQWPASLTPLARIRINISALNFQTRSFGEKTFYGFDDRFFTPFNDGTLQLKNEFLQAPILGATQGIESESTALDALNIAIDDLQTLEKNYGPNSQEVESKIPDLKSDSKSNSISNSISEPKSELDGKPEKLPNYIPRISEVLAYAYTKGASYAGFDLSEKDGLGLFSFLFNMKYTHYRSRTRLNLNIDVFSPSDIVPEKHFEQNIEIQGGGYYFNIAGTYKKYRTGISIESDAMKKTLEQAVQETMDEIDHIMIDQPLLARVDGVLADGRILLGTGNSARLRIGTAFRSIPKDKQIPIIVKIISNQASGAVATLVQGNSKQIESGLLLRQVPTFKENLKKASRLNYRNVRFVYNGFSTLLGQWLGKKIQEVLPSQLLRYFKYDLPHYAEKDGKGRFLFDLTDEEWSHQIGLDRVQRLERDFPIVAVIDSGIDYNHPNLHGALWKNPDPNRDIYGRVDRYGWNFISNDSKPYDSGSHGTRLASLVTTVAPGTKILPLKIFNSGGHTTSAAIFAAFTYAVDHGAQIILCGWSTMVNSSAIEMGITYAHAHGRIVVTEMGSPTTYPAALAEAWDNVLAVTPVSSADDLLSETAQNPKVAKLAAPGQDILVAEPGLKQTLDTTSSGLAAAITAGALSRILAHHSLSGTYLEWLDELFENAENVPKLETAIPKGIRLFIPK